MRFSRGHPQLFNLNRTNYVKLSNENPCLERRGGKKEYATTISTTKAAKRTDNVHRRKRHQRQMAEA